MSSKRRREDIPEDEDVDALPRIRIKVEKDLGEEEITPQIRIKVERELFEPEADTNTTENESTAGDQDITDPVPEVQNHPEAPKKSKISPGGSASGAEPPPLSNFMKFTSEPLPSVRNSNVMQNKSLGEPPPKVPKVSAYNDHDDESEKAYVGEQERANQKDVIHDQDKNDSESEPEEDDNDMRNSAQDGHAGRYFQKGAVYSKFNFEYRKIDTSRLAVYEAKDKILSAIDKHRVVIVDGFTGCGKTTQVPQFIVDKCRETGSLCNVVVTQPRRIAAISVAKRVCYERGWEVGSVVGYQVGMDAKKDKNSTLITYMTTGVLLQKLISTKSLKDFTHVIIDEVHERDLESDLLLLVIKKILQDDIAATQRHVKLILMSATLNAKKFSQYFPIKSDASEYEDSPVVKIPHAFRHRVDELFLDNILSNNRDMFDMINANIESEKAAIPEELYTVAVDCIVGLDEMDRRNSSDPRVRGKNNAPTSKRGSVLVFLPGMEEINRLYRSLNAKNRLASEENPKCKELDYYKWEVVPLHSCITNEEQDKVFYPPRDFYRKIILSTNIAESSITVPDVTYIIDFCLTKSLCIDQSTNFTTLRMVWASVSQCIQRKGRTGRVCDGKVFRLVPKAFFSSLAQDTQPEMLRANLETVVLQLKKLNMGSPKNLLAIALDPPKISGIERAVANLKELGALTVVTRKEGRSHYDTCDGDITFLGMVMTDLPIPQQCTRLIMLGYCFGVMKEAIIIAAALSVKNPFSTPFVKQLEAYLSKLSWSKKSCSDLFALYYVYKHWIGKFSETGDFQGRRNQYNEKQWARGAFVQLSVLREIKSTVELIEERLAKHGLYASPIDNDAPAGSAEGLTKEAGLMLKLAIAGAFYPNFFHRRRPDLKSYEREKSKEVSGLDLYNTVYFKGFPTNHDGKVYAKYVSDYLSFGLNVPSIKYDGQKVFGVFDNRGEKIGPISKGVYRAVKRRQLRDQLEFPIAQNSVEAETVKSWNLQLERRRFTRCPPPVQLPGIHASDVYVRVTHVENPGQFWINYSANADKLDEMIQVINDELLHTSMPSSKIVPNALCLAPYLRTYYRAKILQTSPQPIDESLVYFVDYGNTSWVRNSVLKDFSPSMVEKRFDTVPCLAVECRLSNTKPATIHGAGWHERAIKEFKLFAEKAPFIKLQIYSVTKSVIAAKVVGHNTNMEVEKVFNEVLVDLGFAEHADEPTFSEFNHRARSRVELQDKEEISAHNVEQIGEQLDFDCIIPPVVENGRYNTTLKGPWSPLELDFQALCHSSNTKLVKVDNNSVNSVVLDTEPTAPISRLMVSACVSIQDRTGGVVARATTMMPSVPGLLGLLSMLFAPKMELRVDIRQTQYTGVLCGLGTAPGDPDLPIYSDHDVEIVFDTIYDDEDIDAINKIRFLMNLLLRNSQGVNMSHYQRSVFKELMTLLQRVRKRADEEVWPQEEYVWNRLDINSLNPPNPASFNYDPKDIFVPHNKVLLNKENESSWAWNFAV